MSPAKQPSSSVAQFDAIKHVKHVVGIARNSDDAGASLTVLLEKIDAQALAEVERWSKTTATPVIIKVIGPIML